MESRLDDDFLTTNYFKFSLFNENIKSVYNEKLNHCFVDKYLLTILPSCFAECYWPIKTPSEGNCMWHMISRSLCGNCSLTSLLKDMTVITLLVLEQKFIEIMISDIKSNNKDANEMELKIRATQRFQRIVQIAKTPDEWGDEYHLLAISTFLAMKISIYNFFNSNFSKNELLSCFRDVETNKSGFHLIYTPLQSTIFSSFKKNYMIYGYYDPKNKHYTSLIPQKGENMFIPKVNLFAEFSEKANYFY